MRALLLACLAAGCDPLAGADYVGDPMFTLTGALSSPSLHADDIDGIALMWQDPAGADGPGVAATAVPVSANLAAFHVAIPLPPPDVARFSFADTSVELAEAYVFAVADAGDARGQARGVDRGHVVVFASDAVAPGTLAADYLGGPLGAGYHLRRFTATDQPTRAQAEMIERCTAIASRPACVARRGYTLAAAADDERLKIVVLP